MKITYSSWKVFKECPKRFNLEYIQREPSKIPIDDYYKLYGNLVGKFFELYTNQWRFQTPNMPFDSIDKKLKVLYDGILRYSRVSWNSRFANDTKEEIYDQAYKDTCNVMASASRHYFLNTKAEITINIKMANHHIGGRLDFIYKNPTDDGITIIDGKGTNKIGKYIDKNQLLFYCLLYTLKHKKMPQETGFLYYRFNSYAKIPLSIDILNEFRATLSLDTKAMYSQGTYEATPGYKACKFCPYHVDCKEHIEKKSKSARPSALDIKVKDGEIAQFSF